MLLLLLLLLLLLPLLLLLLPLLLPLLRLFRLVGADKGLPAGVSLLLVIAAAVTAASGVVQVVLIILGSDCGITLRERLQRGHLVSHDAVFRKRVGIHGNLSGPQLGDVDALKKERERA